MAVIMNISIFSTVISDTSPETTRNLGRNVKIMFFNLMMSGAGEVIVW